MVADVVLQRAVHAVHVNMLCNRRAWRKGIFARVHGPALWTANGSSSADSANRNEALLQILRIL